MGTGDGFFHVVDVADPAAPLKVGGLPTSSEGAYGVAVISALWQADDAGAVAMTFLAPWTDDDDD